MNPDHALDQLAEHFGIVGTYHSLAGADMPTSPETKKALLRANGVDVENEAMIIEAWQEIQARGQRPHLPEEWIVRSDEAFHSPLPQDARWEIADEGQGLPAATGSGSLHCPGLASGVYDLTVEQGGAQQSTMLIVAPRQAPSIASLAGQERLWGVNLALYGLHSSRNAGPGDYGDLAAASKAFARHGAGFVGINPVHAIGWESRDVISPYSPSHRGFLDTAPIAVELIEPVSPSTLDLINKWRSQAQRPIGGLINHAAHHRFHQPVLQALFDDFNALGSDDQKVQFRSFCAQEAAALARFARYESLSQTHGTDWRQWPDATQSSPNLAHVAKGDEFHAWLQWIAEGQLQTAQRDARNAGLALGLYLDLAVGARRDGAEAWGERESLADGVSIGAPPDHLSPGGQNWNLAAYAPHKLTQTNYRAFRDMLARNMRRCGVLRIDHVLGFNRSYWIPDNGAPGGYIKQPFETLMALVRIEAEKAGTAVIGEDLGLVPHGFRESLKESGLYSYSVLQYERDAANAIGNTASQRPQSLACFGTHDTPTVRGFIEGRDIDWWRKLNWTDDHQQIEQHRIRREECARFMGWDDKDTAVHQEPGDADCAAFNLAVHDVLARSPAALVSVQLDDILGEAEAQNLPGTVDEHPNWRRPHGEPVEAFSNDQSLGQVAALMAANGRSGLKKEPDWH